MEGCRGEGTGSRVVRTILGAAFAVVLLFTVTASAQRPLPSVPSVDHSATVLVIDVSGSMAWTWEGEVKIESAKKAALQFLEQVANEPRPPGVTHRIGVVTFSNNATVVCPLTDNYATARNTIINLGTASATNLGAGLDTGLQELQKAPSGSRFIILLSDGKSNTGKSRQQVLSTSVATARSRGICIHTVGFGGASHFDGDFLRRIAQESGCGTYNHAKTGLDLFGTYIKIRHSMLGSNRIVEFSSGPNPVTMLAGATATLGAFQLTAPARELHYTLAWAEAGRMQAVLTDPSGKQVTASYPGAKIYFGNGFVHITVLSPQKGIWKVVARATTHFSQGVRYYGVASARTGGIVIPYRLPNLPCIEILGRRICIPVPNLPTAVIVLVAVAVAAVLLYTELQAL